MDFLTLFVFLGSFAVCAAGVLLVSLFGAKEQSFEEALAEQKKKLEKERKGQGGKKAKEAALVGGDLRKRNKAGKAGKGKANVAAGAQQDKDVTDDDAAGETSRSSSPDQLHPIQAEATPEPTPEPPATPEPAPAPKSKGKAKKNKIAIEEVVEEPMMVAEEKVQVQSAPAPVEAAPVAPAEAAPKQPKQSQGGKNKNKQGQQQSSPSVTATKPNARELITFVKKTPFDDGEAQQLIDILLNKQSGSGGGSGDWVDTGSAKSAGQPGSQKQLQKQLTDAQQALEEEQARSKSVTDRMNQLRQELNASKSAQVSSQRVLDELQTRHHTEMSQLQARLQTEVDARHRETTHLQGQLQFQITHAQGLQASLDGVEAQRQQLAAAAAAAAPDAQLLSEMEQLRQTKAAYETELAGVAQEKEVVENKLSETKKVLDESEKEKTSLSGDLSKSQQERQALQDKCKDIEAANQGKVDELDKSKRELESKVNELSVSLKEKEREGARLAEENERLSEQLAASVERPSAEGQEAGGSNGKQNGGMENGHGAAVEERLQQRPEDVKKQQEQETLLRESLSAKAKLQEELDNYQKQMKQIQSELDAQKSKNDALRAKNWKAMEALNNTEQSYQKALKQNQASADVSSAMEKGKRDSESAHKSLLQRLFPDVQAPKADDDKHEAWLEKFAEQVKVKVSEARAEVKAASEAGADEGKVQQLEKQCTQYKTVLAQTESMLNELQASVESEERQWKQRLTEKEQQIDALRSDKDALAQKATALEESLNVVKQAEEMQEKLEELQSKLSEEELEKAEVMHKFAQAQKEIGLKQELEEEVDVLRGQLDLEQQKCAELGLQVARMGQMVTTSQEALQQEQKTVEMLRQNSGSKGNANSSSSSSNESAGGSSKTVDTLPDTAAAAAATSNGPKSGEEATAAQ